MTKVSLKLVGISITPILMILYKHTIEEQRELRALKMMFDTIDLLVVKEKEQMKANIQRKELFKNQGKKRTRSL